MTASFEIVTHVDADPAAVFALALDMDHHSASLSRSGEHAVTSHGGAAVALGDEVTFTARHLGRTWTMTSRVTAFTPPHRFVDEQVRGPFSRMTHEHLFVPAGNATQMIDRVSFTAPLGLIGTAVERLGLTRYFRGLISERSSYIKSVAEAQA